jgi:hypothetical protein
MKSMIGAVTLLTALAVACGGGVERDPQIEQAAVRPDSASVSGEVADAGEPTTERIGVEELKRKLDGGEGFLLIDVREDSELAEHGAIAGAIHIPMGELEERMKDIPKDVEIVFH